MGNSTQRVGSTSKIGSGNRPKVVGKSQISTPDKKTTLNFSDLADDKTKLRASCPTNPKDDQKKLVIGNSLSKVDEEAESPFEFPIDNPNEERKAKKFVPKSARHQANPNPIQDFEDSPVLID